MSKNHLLYPDGDAPSVSVLFFLSLSKVTSYHTRLPFGKDGQVRRREQRVASSGQAIYLQISVRMPRLYASVLAVAEALANKDQDRAQALTSALMRQPAVTDGLGPRSGGASTSPLLRAQTLGRLMLDLASGGWEISVEEGQVFASPPRWSAGAQGLTPEEVRLEKERARCSMAARVQEQIDRPATQQFIYAQERAHYTSAGPRSIVNLLANGPSLADALRRDGATAIRPYLQVADGDSGHDLHTGLRLGDIFRYFRYYWSFPYGSTPGRNLSFLIRDAGQPSHPVCGLLALSSPIPRLGARDSSLGWTAGWLEAIVAALDMAPDRLNDHIALLAEGRSSLLEPKTSTRQVIEDLGALLGLPEVSSAEDLSSAFGRLTPATRVRRIGRARDRLVEDLLTEVEQAFRDICLDGLGRSHEEALCDPAGARRALTSRAVRARARWIESRALNQVDSPPIRPPLDELLSATNSEAFTASPLFLKKRAAQAAHLLGIWEELAPLRGTGPWDALRLLTLGSSDRWEGSRLTGGAKVTRAVRAALFARQTRMLASQIVDVSVCGALPPYGPLLGGKLAALLALSKEPAHLYHERYNGQSSEIASQMAGRPLIRPADLVVLTTTSFYGVGSSQYARLRLDELGFPVRWRLAGYSRGHGTLHVSRETTELLHRLIELETGQGLHTSTFGEGPSARLRKVRDGLVRLGLNADMFLQHGMPRQVFVAELDIGSTRPGMRPKGPPWRSRGASVEEVTDYFQRRWLAPRLSRMPALISEVEAFRREDNILSRRLGSSSPNAIAQGEI